MKNKTDKTRDVGKTAIELKAAGITRANLLSQMKINIYCKSRPIERSGKEKEKEDEKRS